MSPHPTTRFPYAGWPDEAVDLVETSIRAHGGWEKWKHLEVVRFETASLGGLLPRIKGVGRSFFLPRRLELRPHRGVAIFEAYPDKDKTGIYEQGVVSLVETMTTETLIGSAHHRKTFAGRAKHRRWTLLDALYFFGYTLLHCYSVPFTLGEARFVGMSLVRSEGEDLTAIDLEFPRERETHCTSQTFFFDREGLVRRHDYVAEIVNSFARGCHFWKDYEMVGGFRFPMKHHVVAKVLGSPSPITVLYVTFRRIDVES